MTFGIQSCFDSGSTTNTTTGHRTGIRVNMTRKEIMEEEMCAMILAKLEELDQKWYDMNRKIEERNAQLCRHAESPASSSPSPTTSPPQDASAGVPIVT